MLQHSCGQKNNHFHKIYTGDIELSVLILNIGLTMNLRDAY